MITWQRSFCLGPAAQESTCILTSPSALESTDTDHARLDRSCLLHRFVKNEWRVLSSQTIGVEFASKIIKVGTGARRKRIKLQVGDIPYTGVLADTDSVTALGYRGHRAIPIRLALLLSRRRWSDTRLRHHISRLLPNAPALPQRCAGAGVAELEPYAGWE